jgi:metal-dependent amidase/aminoacylase/carboxypeptidase family protein
MSVIPGSATLVGTVRTFSAAVQALVERRLMNCAAPSPRVLAQGQVTYTRMYPATINTAPEAGVALAAQVVFHLAAKPMSNGLQALSPPMRSATQVARMSMIIRCSRRDTMGL